jgi:putative ABC transport system substrate-binding protein
VRTTQDFASAYDQVRQKNPDVLITVEDPLTNSHREQIARFALEQKLPSMHGFREFVEAGGLMSYGTSLSDLYRRAATYVDRILRGARVGDLPIEQPNKFELVLNLKTAKAIDLTLSPALLARADEVIE